MAEANNRSHDYGQKQALTTIIKEEVWKKSGISSLIFIPYVCEFTLVFVHEPKLFLFATPGLNKTVTSNYLR